MKLKLFPTLLSLIITAAFAYLAYYIANSKGDEGDWLLAIGTGICLLFAILPLIALRLDNDRQNVNMKVWSTIVLFLMLAVNLCFAIFGVAVPLYIVSVVLILCIHFLVLWKLVEIKDV